MDQLLTIPNLQEYLNSLQYPQLFTLCKQLRIPICNYIGTAQDAPKIISAIISDVEQQKRIQQLKTQYQQKLENEREILFRTDTYTFPPSCIDNYYINSTPLGSGLIGSTYISCNTSKRDQCSYVVKVLEIITPDINLINYSNQLPILEAAFWNEVNIQKLASGYDIAPKIINAHICESISDDGKVKRFGFILMDRWTMTLDQYMKQLQLLNPALTDDSPINQYISQDIFIIFGAIS